MGRRSGPPFRAGGSPGTVDVEVGGLARTDNSGWGDEFERLCDRLLAGFEAPTAQRAMAGSER